MNTNTDTDTDTDTTTIDMLITHAAVILTCLPSERNRYCKEQLGITYAEFTELLRAF